MFISLRINKRIITAVFVLVVASLLVFPLLALRKETAPAIATQNTVFLTFDDGPSAHTDKLLDVLKAQNVKATFFITAQNPDCFKSVTRANEEGHLIALHTSTHEFSEIYQSTDAFWADIDLLNEQIFSLTGKHSTILRFPGGSSNTIGKKYGGENIMKQLVEQCYDRGISHFDWNIDTKDAEAGTKSASFISERVISRAKEFPDSVVLMHDGGMNSTVAEATEQIIIELKKQGYSFDTLDHLAQPVHHNLT